MRRDGRPVAVLTGATGGIGKEIAHLLVARGYQVHAITRRPESLADELPGLGDALVPVTCDIMDAAEIVAASQRILKAGVEVRLLIHCAGSIHPEAIADLTDRHIAMQIGINLTAPILLTRHLVGGMGRGGHILFVNSMAGVLPLEGNSVYTATKFGLRGFARSVSLDLRAKGIRVSSVFPGAVDTAMLAAEMESGGSCLNFVSTPIPPHDLARMIVRACHGAGGEFFRPRLDGAFSHACLMMPWLLRVTLPALRWFGKAGQRRYLKAQSGK